jgi:hypothetical protein
LRVFDKLRRIDNPGHGATQPHRDRPGTAANDSLSHIRHALWKDRSLRKAVIEDRGGGDVTKPSLGVAAMVYLWRAVDAEGEVLDVLVQSKRTGTRR